MSIARGQLARHPDALRLPIHTAGWVYVLTNPSMPGLVKIGMTQAENPEQRVTSLASATGVPTQFEPYGFVYALDSAACEASVHEALANQRLNPRREFFQVLPDVALQLVRDEAEAQRKQPEIQRELLLFAVRENDISAVSEIADVVSSRDVLDRSMSAAIKSGADEVAVALLNAGANPNGLVAGCSLYAVAIEAELHRLQRALEAMSVDPDYTAVVFALNCATHGDDRALSYVTTHKTFSATSGAIAYNSIGRLKNANTEWLLELGANPNYTEASTGRTLLHRVCEAVREGGVGTFGGEDDTREGMVEALLVHGASLDMRDTQGKTPLCLAAVFGEWDVMQRLLDGGARAWICDNSRNDPLYYAVKRCAVSISTYEKAAKAEGDGSPPSLLLVKLVERGCNPNVVVRDDACGDPLNLLQAAILFGDSALVEACIAAGADVFWASPGRRVTAMHIAAYYNDLATIERLAQLSLNFQVQHPTSSRVQAWDRSTHT